MRLKRGRLPLTALRSFEAAGRLLSFSNAAEELFVSQAAISRQVRELEAAAGTALFERLHRRVTLTAEGQALLQELTSSFDRIDAALTAISGAQQKTVTVSADPTFASLWLLPNLQAFRRLRPDIDIAVEADPRLVEFRNSPVQMAVRHAVRATSWPRVESRLLHKTVLSPVMPPSFASDGALRLPKDLAAQTLLHDENRDGWAHWFEAAGLAEIVPSRGPIFPDGAFAVNAARLGHGVALGDLLLLKEELASGALMQPFNIELAFGAYWLVAPSFAKLSEPAAALADWLAASLSS
jgi:LysR family transcriptional regulator, glycine cleavage system transcriptional activator